MHVNLSFVFVLYKKPLGSIKRLSVTLGPETNPVDTGRPVLIQHSFILTTPPFSVSLFLSSECLGHTHCVFTSLGVLISSPIGRLA